MADVQVVVFTGPDKALLDRAARSFDAQAKALNWEAITDPKRRKAAKLEFDRLKRDAFDLRALGIRSMALAKRINKGMLVLQEPRTWDGSDRRAVPGNQ